MEAMHVDDGAGVNVVDIVTGGEAGSSLVQCWWQREASEKMVVVVPTSAVTAYAGTSTVVAAGCSERRCNLANSNGAVAVAAVSDEGATGGCFLECATVAGRGRGDCGVGWWGREREREEFKVRVLVV